MNTETLPIGLWTRTSRSRRDLPPPHRFPDEEFARLDIVWADHDRRVPLAVNDYDGCYALVDRSTLGAGDLLCGQCGDRIPAEQITGHLASEGRLADLSEIA